MKKDKGGLLLCLNSPLFKKELVIIEVIGITKIHEIKLNIISIEKLSKRYCILHSFILNYKSTCRFSLAVKQALGKGQRTFRLCHSAPLGRIIVPI